MSLEGTATSLDARRLCMIVEPRNHCALLDTVRNVSEALDCRVLLAHGTGNESLAKEVEQALPPGRVSLERLPTENLTPYAYSDVLMSTSMWERIRENAEGASHVLIFQTDSGVCRQPDEAGTNSLLGRASHYEYCGAPWPPPGEGVGNGGFSFRDVEASLRALQTSPVPKGSDVPEDVFFSSNLQTCPRALALSFAAESTWRTEAPLGFHAWWKYGGALAEGAIANNCPQAHKNHFLNRLHAAQGMAMETYREALSKD